MYNAGFRLDPVKDVPQDVQEQASGISLELQQEELRQAQSLVETVRRLSAEYQKELCNIIGKENLERYYEFRVSLRQRIREVNIRAAPTVEGEREIQKSRRQATEESRRFLKEIGFDMERASQLRVEYYTRIQEILSESRGRPEQPNYLVLPEMVPKDIHNPWAIYEPPYPGWAWSFYWYRSDEPDDPSIGFWLSSESGATGSKTSIHVSGADDNDYAAVRFRSGMRLWYYLPVAGQVEVWMKLYHEYSFYGGHMGDESGWSAAACDQECYAYLSVVGDATGATRKSTILDYRRTGTSAEWYNHLGSTGDIRWAHLSSLGTYAAGTWLLLELGTEEWNHFWCNDVSVSSIVEMSWFLQRIYVRSTGE